MAVEVHRDVVGGDDDALAGARSDVARQADVLRDDGAAAHDRPFAPAELAGTDVIMKSARATATAVFRARRMTIDSVTAALITDPQSRRATVPHMDGGSYMRRPASRHDPARCSQALRAAAGAPL
jgi:hypothetical protein